MTVCVVPKCLYDEIWGRRGLERRHRIVCLRTDRVTLAESPEHGELTNLGDPAYDLCFSFRPDDDAPENDRFVLELVGPGGMRRHAIDVRVTPDEINTPPQCDPVEIAKRTLGLERERAAHRGRRATGAHPPVTDDDAAGQPRVRGASRRWRPCRRASAPCRGARRA